MIIKGLEKTTLIDYPEKVACTVFTFGCEFRCPFCHNPELVFDDGTKPIEEKEILDFLEERKGFLDGVCVTGGEPMLHKDLPDFLSRIKKMGFLIKLDTNGTNPKTLEELIDKGLIDYVAMDIKASLEKYDDVTRTKVNKKDIEKSVEIIKQKAPDYEFRITVVPGLIDKKDLLSIGKWLKTAKRIYLQQFQSIKTLDKSYKNKKPYSEQEILEFCELLKPFFGECEVRGI